jgi:hypothetical protein
VPSRAGPSRGRHSRAGAGAGAESAVPEAPPPPFDSGDAVDVSASSVDELSALFSLKDAGKVEEAFAGAFVHTGL